MPKPMTEDKQKIIVNALNKGLSRTQISHVVGVSKRAITRINTNLKKHGSAKPPPSGLKLGRPVRLTNSQIRAMMAWMKEREHMFYVKDLVQYLREAHGYEGCDGTVRRGLLRSGFKKKLPWHKSEVTAWLPPEDGDVVMAFGTDDDDENGGNGDDGAEEEEEGDATATQEAPVNGIAEHASASDVGDASLGEDAVPPAPNIDPRLDLEQHVAAALSQLPNSMPQVPNASAQPTPASPSTPLPNQATRTHSVSEQLLPNARTPSKSTAKRKTPTAKRNNTNASTISPSTGAGQAALENQLSAMQSQLAQQQDTIAKLQQQLAAAQQTSPALSTPVAPVALMTPHRPERNDDKSPTAQRESSERSPQPPPTDARDGQSSPEQSYEIQYEV